MSRFFLCCMLLCLCGCAGKSYLITPDDKAKKLIKEYITNNLGDLGSYEPITTSPTDSTFYQPYWDEVWERYNSVKDSLDKMYYIYMDLGLYDKAIDATKESRKFNDDFFASIDTLSYEHDGYGVFHKFRAANHFGGKEIFMLYFALNKELDSVISVDTITMQDIYDLKEDVGQRKDRLDSLNSYESADLKRYENIINAALN